MLVQRFPRGFEWFRAVAVLALLGLLGAQYHSETEAAQTGDQARIDPALQARMAADPAGSQPVIVEMEHATPPFGAQPNLDRAQQAVRLLTTYAQPIGALPLVGSAAGWATSSAIQTLSAQPGVAFVHLDRTVGLRANAAPWAPRLGAASRFAVLGGTTVTNTGATTVNADLGVSPGSAVTGFPPGTVAGGSLHAADALALQAQTDTTSAYASLAAQACTPLTGDLGGRTLAPGVYCYPSAAQLTGTLTLDAHGNPNAVFVFQIGSLLTTASHASVILINAGSACSVFWQVGSSATLGTRTTFVGTILALTSITLTTGATVSGRALARNGAVTMDTNTVGAAGCASGGGTPPLAGGTRSTPSESVSGLASPNPRAALATQAGPRAKGAGVTVAVLDSGVAPDQDLDTRVVASVSFAGSAAQPDPGGHGTHIAGIVAGSGVRSAGEYVGMAPAASLVDVRVLDANGNGRLSSVIRGIEWVLAHRLQYHIRVINLSLGAPPAPAYRADLLAGAVELAWRAGIVVVVAAGNDGPTPGTVQSPGSDPFAITVGATDDQGTLSLSDDQLAWFSAWGTPSGGQPKPDLVAPGRRLVSIRVAGSTLDGLFPDHRVTAANGSAYFRLTGTSQATGVVSGAAALVLARQPALTPDQVKQILVATTQAYGPNGTPVLPDPLADGSGLLDAGAAYASSALGSANAGLDYTDSFARSIYSLIYGQPLVWRDPTYHGIQWRLLNWSTLTWDRLAWDNIAWDGSNWNSIAWDGSNWNTTSWDNIAWDKSAWDSLAWDNIVGD
jgi:ice-binding like protein/subtilase family protein